MQPFNDLSYEEQYSFLQSLVCKNCGKGSCSIEDRYSKCSGCSKLSCRTDMFISYLERDDPNDEVDYRLCGECYRGRLSFSLSVPIGGRVYISVTSKINNWVTEDIFCDVKIQPELVDEIKTLIPLTSANKNIKIPSELFDEFEKIITKIGEGNNGIVVSLLDFPNNY